MTSILTPSELIDRLAGGLDDSSFADGSAPVVVLDLDAPDDSGALARVVELLGSAPVVMIGTSSAPCDRPEASELDVLLCDASNEPSPWVSCPSGAKVTAARLVDAISGSPSAAVSLVQLLRVSATVTAADAVVAESWVYSLLQGGVEHRGWLADRADAPRRPRPDGPVVDVRRSDDVLSVTLDRPEVRNAYGARMRDELVEALLLADLDRTITMVEVRGNGPVFCSGGDLDEFGTAPGPLASHLVRTTRNAGIVLSRLAPRVRFEVHGSCVGAGVELPAFAGRVIATSDATFRLPEVAMGLVPGAGGTSSIPRRIGRHRTAFMALSGDTFDAPTALRWGLIDEVRD